MKRKRIDRILSRLYDPALWPCPWPWPWSVKVRVWDSLTLGMGRLIWNKKDVSHPFMTMILNSVTMLGWVDLPDSDRGDFRRQCAVGMSSCQERTETINIFDISSKYSALIPLKEIWYFLCLQAYHLLLRVWHGVWGHLRTGHIGWQRGECRPSESEHT